MESTCLAEKQQIPIYSLWFDQIRTQTHTCGEHANNYTTEAIRPM
jgi:hypothetical protein